MAAFGTDKKNIPVNRRAEATVHNMHGRTASVGMQRHNGSSGKKHRSTPQNAGGRTAVQKSSQNIRHEQRMTQGVQSHTQAASGNAHRADAYGRQAENRAARHGSGNAAHREAEREIRANALPETKQRHFYDTSLLCAVIFIFALGLLIIYSSSQYMAQLERGGDPAYYFKRQLVIGGAGLVGAIIMSFVDYRIYARLLNGRLIRGIYWCSIGLLVMTLVMGVASHGKARWISIGGVQFQPAEVAKIALILWLANFIAKNGRAFKKPENIKKAIGAAVLPTLLILKQNISSAIIVALIAAVMIFVAVDNKKIFVILGGGAAAFIALLKPAISFFIQQTGYSTRPEKYYLRRILGWAAPDVFPDDAYQTLQSLYAIGSGGITGHGLGESIQKFGKIPEVQNDMIFAIICEEFGFIGAATIVLLFLYLIFRIYQIAKNAEDVFGTMICTGVMAHIGIQAVLNIAVVTGVIPNTGVTLPFISYGGSAILFTMCEIGLVLSVAHRIPR